MSFLPKPIIVFNSGADTGVEKIPLNSYVQIHDDSNNGTGDSRFILVTSVSGFDSNSTVINLLASANYLPVLTDGKGFSDAVEVTNTPAGNIVATDVQSAIDELDDEKVALTGNETIAGVKTFDKNIVMGSNADILSPYNFKNRIANGSFNVWQDPDVSYTETSRANGADLFFSMCWLHNAGGGVYTKTLMGNSNAVRNTITTVPTGSNSGRGTWAWDYSAESVDIFDCLGGDITISFKMKSNVTGLFPITIGLGEGGTQHLVKEVNYLVSDVEQKVVFTLSLPENSSLLYPLSNDPGELGVYVSFANIGGSDRLVASTDVWYDGFHAFTSNSVDWTTSIGNYVETSELQLEKGLVATLFEIEPYDVTLARVQRRFQIIKQDEVMDWATISNGVFWAVRELEGAIHFPVVMRKKPSLRYSNITHFSVQGLSPDYTVTSLDGDYLLPSGGLLSATISVDAVKGDAGVLALDVSGAWIAFDART